MIFTIQHFLEDYFHKRNLSDSDQYAIKLANLYGQRRQSESSEGMLSAMRRVRTIFYRNNPNLDRHAVEKDILGRLDDKFQKKNLGSSKPVFSAVLSTERTNFTRLRRRSIGYLLRAFKHATEARAVDTLWTSRSKGLLRPRPEKVAQGLLCEFIMGVLSNGSGRLWRELASGVGFADVVIMFGNTPHLVEMKVLRGILNGVGQLEAYMQSEQRRQGWLLIFDARPPLKRALLPEQISTASGLIHVVRLDINPVAPSRKPSPQKRIPSSPPDNR